MKAMVFTMMAAALMMVAASAYAGMSSSEVVAIDSNNHAVVSISQSAYPITVSSSDTVTLDSNGLWVASDYSKLSGDEAYMASGEESMEHSGSLYCFDSSSKFCAVAF